MPLSSCLSTLREWYRSQTSGVLCGGVVRVFDFFLKIGGSIPVGQHYKVDECARAQVGTHPDMTLDVART